ncbi:MAG: SdpI family protein [Planctomycetes bacterium]|nr:SdpI family protein [Planctomycetota bacterium]HNZ65978.1 SdpI family protein [Planctomycetota bacterium]HNZ65979.1 SdpI family protein [Planctomycetota bacterium]
MGDWTFTFFKVMLIPIISMVGGLFGIYIPPIEINSMFGYRSLMSKKSQETWDFAQQHSGKLFWILGKYLFILSPLPILCVCWCDKNIVEIVESSILLCQVLVMLFSIILTEIALKKNFDKNGNRKQTPIYKGR